MGTTAIVVSHNEPTNYLSHVKPVALLLTTTNNNTEVKCLTIYVCDKQCSPVCVSQVSHINMIQSMLLYLHAHLTTCAVFAYNYA